MYPDPNMGPLWGNPHRIALCYVGIYGFFHPQEFVENTINTMGTLLGVHPIVPWQMMVNKGDESLPSLESVENHLQQTKELWREKLGTP